MRRVGLPIAFIFFLVAGASAQDILTIHHLDVGTGDSTLLIMPNGNTLLVDAGLDGAAARVIAPFLRDNEITSLDAFVLTHYDSDHMGGVDKLVDSKIENISVDTFLTAMNGSIFRKVKRS